MPKPLTVWITTNWNILQEIGIPDPLTCLLRNLYAGQETTVRTGHGTTDWFQIGKGVHQGCILSPVYLIYAEHIMRNARLKHKLESRLPGEIAITSDTQMTLPLWQKAKKNLVMKEESGKRWLKTQHSKNEDHGIWSHHFMANRWGNNETMTDFIFLDSKNHCRL